MTRDLEESERAFGGLGSKGDFCTCPFCGRSFLKEKTAEEPVLFTVHCKRCGFEWNSKVEHPVKCPKCGTYKWDAPRLDAECKICHYRWCSRTEEGPERCPNCKSRDWRTGEDNSRDEDNANRRMSAREKRAGEARRREDIEEEVVHDYDCGDGCFDIARRRDLSLLFVMRVVKTHVGNRLLRY